MINLVVEVDDKHSILNRVAQATVEIDPYKHMSIKVDACQICKVFYTTSIKRDYWVLCYYGSCGYDSGDNPGITGVKITSYKSKRQIHVVISQ